MLSGAVKGLIQQPVSLSGPTLRVPTDNLRDAAAAPPGMSPSMPRGTGHGSTLDEQLFDHGDDAPIRSKFRHHNVRRVRTGS
jgi:hypothetical protein